MIRWKLKNDAPVFNRPLRTVVKEYFATQQERADHHKIWRISYGTEAEADVRKVM